MEDSVKKILIVEDDREIRRQLAGFLANNGYECQEITDFSRVVEEVIDAKADMLLLDLTLPGADGAGILRNLRKKSDLPVIIVTSKNTEMDEVICMSYGADDFIAKPYNPAILLLHMEAVFKRLSHSEEESIVEYENIRLDIGRGTMEIVGRETGETESLELTKNETRILAYLIRHREKIVSREELISYLWDSQEFVDDNTLTVNINRVRGKLKEHGIEDLIQTKRGIGYKLG